MTAPDGAGARDSLPPDLEQRIVRLETGGQCGDDFDAASVGWLLALGVLLPLVLLVVGWWE
jgi:hypothetical protein